MNLLHFANHFVKLVAPTGLPLRQRVFIISVFLKYQDQLA